MLKHTLSPFPGGLNRTVDPEVLDNHDNDQKNDMIDELVTVTELCV